jgi:hypothetical protein
MPLASPEYCEDGEEGDDEREDGVGNEVAQGVVAVGHDEGTAVWTLKTRDMTTGGTMSGAEVAEWS